MASAFERFALSRLIEKADALGIEVPERLLDLAMSTGHQPSRWAADQWAELHPDDEDHVGCCYGEINDPPSGCTCWVPEFDTVQAEPCPPRSMDDLTARSSMCGDCAFRPGSNERADEWMADALVGSTYDVSRPFWCHDGMRKPDRWRHPDGRVVEGSPDDWQPPMVGRVPFRLDGSPGLICAGWFRLALRNHSPRGE